MTTRLFVAGVALAALAAPSRGARAQVMASEHAMVAQTVNGATITVEYYRPQARGREIFGKVVTWGRHWTPGANWATTLEVDHDMRFEGQPLPRGKYSVWTVPQPDQWTIVLHRTARVFHMSEPDSADVQLRVVVTPQPGPRTEVLTFSFPVVTHDSAELHLQWATTDVPLHLALGAPAGEVALGPRERAAYVGTYRMVPTSPTAEPSQITVIDSAGMLRVRRDRRPGVYYDPSFDLHPMSEHTFAPIFYKDGILMGTEADNRLVFFVEGGRATRLEVHGLGDRVDSRGTRVRP